MLKIIYIQQKKLCFCSQNGACVRHSTDSQFIDTTFGHDGE